MIVSNVNIAVSTDRWLKDILLVLFGLGNGF